ncbi:hypothetical protein GCM10025768_16680 [Microbacterium pseudoresistens]|uniref:ABC-2 type transport system permease protein n=2 Tax=Microbacterium pseudoresistens TaxID=640634 RepID=A0A7Y9ES78_9MICO|nr:hypothetical protein [Microbacterium pseudoresistens]NYD52979.1 ABC-2 type transport system permease protein [Microbacterium pseudoresistens]
MLLLGALRGDRERVVRVALALAATVVATIIAVLAVRSLADATHAAATTVIVLGGSAVVLGFFLAPVLSGTTDQLDPRRFGVFGVDERTMPLTLGLAAFVSVPSLALIVLDVATAATAISLGAPWPLAVLGAVLSLLIAVFAARVGMMLSALLLPERRSRELTSLFALAVIVVAVPVGVFTASLRWDGDVPGPLRLAATVLGFTPLGAATAFPLLAAAGDTAGAWVSGLVAVVTAAIVLAGWVLLVRRALHSTDRPTTVRERPGLGWFALLPANEFGAVAARSLVYWLRDRRYLVNVAIVPVAGVLTVIPLLVAGVPLPLAAALPVPVMALFFGWLAHNDVAYDSTALWVHVASGVRGAADRLGRLVPVLLFAIPVLAIAIPITLAVIGRWSLLPVFVGLSVSLLLCGMGLSSIASVISPYAVSRPGDSPFQQPQRGVSRGALGQAGTLVGAIVLSVPTIVLAWGALADPDRSVLAPLWTGIVTGVVVLAVGAFVGARVYERSGERLMEFVETV